MKTILVTGATGYIGNYVVLELLRNNCRVIATSSTQSKAQQMEWYNRVHYIPLHFEDFKSETDYFSFFGRPTHMLHLAWEGLPNYKSPIHIEVNLPQHRQLLHNMLRNGLQNLTVAGTCLEYGMQEGRLQEDVPARPTIPYAIAKDMLRKGLQRFSEESLILKWIRLFYIYGQGQHPNSLFPQLEAAVARGDTVFNTSGGEQQRDFLPVETAAKYIVKITLQDQITGIINCCSGEPVRVRDFITGYLENKGKSMRLNLGYYPYPDYEPMHFWGDNTKLLSAVDDKPAIYGRGIS